MDIRSQDGLSLGHSSGHGLRAGGAQQETRFCSPWFLAQHTRAHTHTRIRTHTHTHTHTPIRTHACKHTHTYAHTHTHTPIRTHACEHTHTQTRRHACKRTHSLDEVALGDELEGLQELHAGAEAGLRLHRDLYDVGHHHLQVLHACLEAVEIVVPPALLAATRESIHRQLSGWGLVWPRAEHEHQRTSGSCGHCVQHPADTNRAFSHTHTHMHARSHAVTASSIQQTQTAFSHTHTHARTHRCNQAHMRACNETVWASIQWTTHFQDS